jgi:hypothetical protein
MITLPGRISLPLIFMCVVTFGCGSRKRAPFDVERSVALAFAPVLGPVQASRVMWLEQVWKSGSRFSEKTCGKTNAWIRSAFQRNADMI